MAYIARTAGFGVDGEMARQSRRAARNPRFAAEFMSSAPSLSRLNR
jgi:hypothetical protein